MSTDSRTVSASSIKWQAQAINSSTFKPPPFDAVLGLHEIYDYHLENSPRHPLFTWKSDIQGLQTLTWADVARATHRAAHFIARHSRTSIDENSSAPPVIAVLASTDPVTFVCLMVGLIRAGYQCFCISPRNSVAGVRSLLDAVNACGLIVHSNGPLYAVAEEAIAGLNRPINIIPPPTYVDLFPRGASDFTPFPSLPLKRLDIPAIIMHSSGSTSFPKPRAFTHQFILQQTRVPCFGHVDLCNEVLSTHAVPLFHAQGLYNTLLPLFTGMILGISPPDSTNFVPTPEYLIQGIVDTRSTILITVPAFLEQWAENSEMIQKLSRLKVIFCGAAPLNRDVAAVYRNCQVPIVCYLAATEYGIATLMVPAQVPTAGPEWFTLSPHLSPAFIPQDDPNVVELVFKSSQLHTPAVINTVVDGHDAYATGDLIIRHALHPNLWKVHGRLDDQIMLSTGEKTNPGPIEAIISRSPYVKACVVFGCGKFQNGVIIEPKQNFDPSDAKSVVKMRRDVWPTVEEANRFAPSHSRIFKEMIIFSHPSKPFEPTLKNTLKRHMILAMYKNEIETAYTAVSESAQEEILPPTEWTLDKTTAFVRRVILGVLLLKDAPLKLTDDIFFRGADSLQATWIRNSILRGLRGSNQLNAAKNLPSSFVYDHPSIASLSSCIFEAVSLGGHKDGIVPTTKIRRMEDFVSRYAAQLPETPGPANGFTKALCSKKVVVLTGSTGSLGTQILAALLNDPHVSRIFALNRRTEIPIVKRQHYIWKDRGLDPSILHSDKVVYVEVDADGKLANDARDLIRDSATLFIHNAWTVDFKLGLSSFESNLRFLKNLLELALLSTRPHRPRFMLISTIGVFRNWPDCSPVPEICVPDMAYSVGSGYTESKCVAERIVECAATNLNVCIVRAGQLTGGSNGAWQTNEWVPALVKSGTTLGILPDIQGIVSWLPQEAAASSLLEICQRGNSTPGTTYIHLVHPRPVTWRVIMEPISEALGVSLVSCEKWYNELQSLASHSPQEPAVKLLGFFSAVKLERGTGAEVMGFPLLGSETAQALAPESLGGMSPLSRKDVSSWITYWRNKGFL